MAKIHVRARLADVRHNGSFIDARRCMTSVVVAYAPTVRYDGKRVSLGTDKRDTGEDEAARRWRWWWRRKRRPRGRGERRASENSPVDTRRRYGGSVVGVIASGGGCLLLVLGK